VRGVSRNNGCSPIPGRGHPGRCLRSVT
jgi:hypothetical protein